MQLSKNFQLSEFSSGSVTPQIQVNLILLARQLQTLRDYFNLPIKIILGVSSTSEEHRSGKAAIFSISGKSADQIKAALENLIAQGAVYNGTIWLLNGNEVYYSLSPMAGRADKRANTPTTGGGSSTTQNNDTSETTIENRNKALMITALAIGLIIVGKVMLKNDKNKMS